MFTIPTKSYVPIELEIARDCYGLSRSDCLRLIKDHDLVARILQEDKEVFPSNMNCYCSHRLNLILKKGKVISVSIG